MMNVASVGTARTKARSTAQLSRGAYVTVGTILALFWLMPLLYIGLRSLLPASVDVDGLSLGSLSGLTLDNYATIFAPETGILTYVKNSLILALGVMVLTCVVALFAGYALSRIKFRFSGIFFIIILAPMVVPFQGLLTPLSLVLSKLGLLDSLLGLILVISTLQLPFSVFIMRNTFDSVPPELEEAAQLDGAGPMGILARVMLPLTWPGMTTVALFGFMAGWNDLLASVVFLSTNERYTLPIALTTISASLEIPGVTLIDSGLLTATAAVATIPVVIIFLLLQRYYTEGLVGGAIK